MNTRNFTNQSQRLWEVDWLPLNKQTIIFLPSQLLMLSHTDKHTATHTVVYSQQRFVRQPVVGLQKQASGGSEQTRQKAQKYIDDVFLCRRLKTRHQIQEVTEVSPTESWPNKGINKYDCAPTTHSHTHLQLAACHDENSCRQTDKHWTWTQTIISSAVFRRQLCTSRQIQQQERLKP